MQTCLHLLNVIIVILVTVGISSLVCEINTADLEKREGQMQNKFKECALFSYFLALYAHFCW